jgi:hypothetical protein
MRGVKLAILAIAAAAAVAVPMTAGATAPRSAFGTSLASADCSSGARTLSKPGDRVYPDQGNGGYTSLHTDLHIAYDTATNLFLPGTRADLTVRTTQCLTDFSFDFERASLSGSAAGPNMAVGAVSINGVPATFAFKQPTYPGNPNGPDDPDPAAHAISNQNPVSATNPNPPACSPQTSGNAQNGLPCPANKLVITPASPIAAGATITVRVEYTGRPGLHTDGDGSTEGWFRVNTAAAPNDGGFVTTEPVGAMAWMPLNNHPTAKPTYDVYDTVPPGKVAIAPGTLEGIAPGPDWAPVLPTRVNAPDANFPSGSWTWHWHAPEPIANYLVTNTIGSYDFLARRSPITGLEYYQAMASGLTAARKTAIKAVLDQHDDITVFQERFLGPFPFTTNGVIVALPNVGFAEEMQTKITFGNGASSTPSLGTFHHENWHQWFGDHVSESAFRMTFWKEGWARIGEHLNTARNAATPAGGLGTPAGDAAFETSLVNSFNSVYNSTSSTAWTSAPSNPTVANLFTTVSTYNRPGATYLALRAILGSSVSRPFEQDRFVGAMRQILRDYGGGTITQPQLQDVFHAWLPNQSAGCHARLDEFFTQWFDTAYPAGGGLNKPQITGPGLAGPGFYDDAGACPRAEQAILFPPLPDLPPDAPDFAIAASSNAGLPVTLSAAGACTIAGSTVHLTGPGTCTITASQAGTGVWKPASVVRSFDVHRPELTVDAPPVQYSDAPDATVSATDIAAPGSALTATATGLPSGLSLAVASTSADAVRPGARTWELAGIAGAPGSYPVTVTVANDDGTSESASFTLVVLPEDAAATYTGDTLVGSSGTLVLRATVEDAADGSPGDVRNATVTFTEGGAVLCGPVPVALVADDPRLGSATCSAAVAEGSHSVDVVVGGYYDGGDGQVVDAGDDEGHVSLTGDYRASDGAGTLRADDGSKTKLHLQVAYRDRSARQKPKESLTGKATLEFTSRGRAYELTTEAIDALGVTALDGGRAGRAELRATATLADVTRPRAHTVVGRGLTLVVTLTERRTEADSVGITVWDGGTLVLSSRWSGAETAERPLEHGKADVK